MLFYVCGVKQLHYLYLLFLSAVSAVMICSVQWLSWFEADGRMSVWKTLYIAFNFGVYLLIAFRKESNITWKTWMFVFVSFFAQQVASIVKRSNTTGICYPEEHL